MNNLMKIAKKIVIEGAKVVTFGAGTVVIYTAVTEGVEGVKNLDLDTVLKLNEGAK